MADLLARLRALEAEATPGPWEEKSDDLHRAWLVICKSTEHPTRTRGLVVAELVAELRMNDRKSLDAALIAAARNALPALLEVAEKARQVLDQVDVDILNMTACGACGQQHYDDHGFGCPVPALRAALRKMEEVG